MNEKTIADELTDIFKLFDRDDDGYICRSELQELLLATGYSPAHIKEFVERLLDEEDSEGEGSIDLKSFVKSMLTDRKSETP